MYFPCIDDYFTEHNNRRRAELGQPFGPSLAGGGLAFLLADTQVASCLQAAGCCVISGTTDFYLVSHIDCGAYKYFAGVDWKQHPMEVQVASLWRDLHLAEQVIRDFLRVFRHPLDSDWRPPEVTYHLEVIGLDERPVPEPASLEAALDLSHYRSVKVLAAR
jgi:hypothetical protein